MVKEFKDRNLWALILGGSRGLGLASANKLAGHGLNLIVIHRDRKADLKEFEEKIKEWQTKGIYVITFNVDATLSEKRAEVLEKLKERLGKEGKIKLMLHSIARGNLKTMTGEAETSLRHDDFQLTINAMAISLYDWFKEVFSAGLFAPASSVISFTSEGNKKAWKYYGAVSAAKAALEAITRNIALEFASSGIRANCIQAGITDTYSSSMIPGFEQLRSFAAKRNPFNRLTEPEDVANAVYLLVREEAGWINGAVIPVDGGEHLS